MAIENLRVIGDVLYERRSDGQLYPVRRVAGQQSAQSAPQADQGSMTGFPELDSFIASLGHVNQMFNPVEGVGQSMAASRRMMDQNAGGWDRVGALGDMLSGVAGVVAPAGAASRAGTPAAVALMEGLLGGSPTTAAIGDAAKSAGRKIAERANQPGPMPTTYSNPIPGLLGDATAAKIDEVTGLPLNADGTITLYHGTTKDAASSIIKDGRLKSAGEPDVYLTTDKAGGGYGDGTVVAVNVHPKRVMLDDEFPDGRMDFRLPVGSKLASPPLKVGIVQPEVSMADNAVKQGLLGDAARTDQAIARGDEILGLLKSGRASEVTDQMLDMGDPVLNARLSQHLYQNYDLPMDEASRMARAKLLNRDTAAYRGTMSDEFSAIRPKIFVSQNPEVVQSYAGHISFADEIGLPPELAQAEGGNIIPLSVDPSKNSSIVKGYELHLPSSDIRSRFARFDPRLSHLKNLSASLGGLGLLGYMQESDRR